MWAAAGSAERAVQWAALTNVLAVKGVLYSVRGGTELDASCSKVFYCHFS